MGFLPNRGTILVVTARSTSTAYDSVTVGPSTDEENLGRMRRDGHKVVYERIHIEDEKITLQVDVLPPKLVWRSLTVAKVCIAMTSLS